VDFDFNYFKQRTTTRKWQTPERAKLTRAIRATCKFPTAGKEESRSPVSLLGLSPASISLVPKVWTCESVATREGKDSDALVGTRWIMQEKRIIRVVIASPNDVAAERDALPAVFDELNQGIAAERGLLLVLQRYETDAHPGLHEEGPQGLIDPILNIEDCDILIGIFWKRFGTPTRDAQSGTEHEISLALNAWQRNGRPQVMLYFNREEYYPKSLEEIDQSRRVMEFEQGLPKQALQGSYKGLTQFKDVVRVHLSNLIRNMFKSAPAEMLAAGRPEDAIQMYRTLLAHQVGTVRIFDDADLHPLEEVFVELNVTEEYERPSISSALLGLMDFAMRRQRNPYLVEEEAPQSEEKEGKGKRTLKPIELLRRHVKAIITGAPGCGKTTLLKYMVLRALTEGKRFPVHLELKTINRQLFAELKEDLAELLFEKAVAGLLQLKTTAERDEFRSFFFDQLKRGEVSIFLDGLDEVHGQEFFPNLCKSVNAFMRSIYRHNDLIITTRPYALTTRFEGMVEMEIAPLNQKQIQAFIDHYYGATAVARQLSQHLRRHRELSELARVPFLLGLIAELYRQQGQIVGVRLQLYREIVKRLVIKLDKEKSVDRFIVKDPNGTYKRDLLKRLAYERLFVDSVDRDIDRLVFTDDDILKKARQVFRAELQPEHLVSDVIATPILREVASNTYAFSHLTIQEYLAAEALSEQENCESIFCQKMFNPTVVAMEVLPKALGLVRSPNSLYQALEQLPESLVFTNLRLRARGTSYLEDISQQHLDLLINQVLGYLTTPHLKTSTHLQVIITSFAAANNRLQESLIEKVTPLLRLEDASVRLRAASVLGELGAEGAVDELLLSLFDPDAGVSQAAAVSLGKIGDDRTVEGLFAILDRCKLSDPAPQSLFEEGSTAPSTEQSRMADEVLGAGGTRQNANVSDLVIELNHGARDPLDAALGALQHIGNARVLDRFLAMMKDERWFLREMAARLLGKMGDTRGLNCLIDALKDEMEPVRIAAALALGQLRDPGAVESLVEVMESGNVQLLHQAIQSLGMIGDARALKPLLMALKTADEYLRGMIAAALGEIGDGRAISWLTVLMKEYRTKSPDGPQHYSAGQVHQAVTQALAKIGGTRAVDVLLSLLKDEGLDKRWMAAAALGEIGDPRAVDGLLVQLEDPFVGPREAAAEALGKIGDRRAIDALVGAVQDAKPGVRAVAAQALKKISNRHAVEGLVAILQHDDFKVRALAARTLSDIGDTYATGALMTILGDVEPGVRLSAVAALGKLVDRRAVEPLLTLLTDPVMDVRRATVQALGSIGDQRAVGGLLELLQDRDEATRVAAAKALGNIHDVRAIEGLIAAMKADTPGMRWYSAQALGKMNDGRAVDALLEGLQDSDSKVRLIIVNALGLARYAPAIGGLLATLKDKDRSVRQAAMAALRKLNNEVMATGLEEALTHPDEFVRKRAAQVVGYYSTDPQVLVKLSQLADHDPAEEVRRVAGSAKKRYACKLNFFA
jgi:HEAT repeat protein